MRYLGALAKTTTLKRLKLSRLRPNRLSVACIIGILLFSRGFWVGAIASLMRGWLPLSEKADKPVPSQNAPAALAQKTLADCHVNTTRPAILTIFAGTEIGTGSIVSSDGLVLTNEHVVREVGYGEIRARQWGGKLSNGQKGKLYKGQVLATDPAHDLALVKLKTQERLPTIAFAKPEAIQNGQAVCALGSPRAITGVLARGKLLGTRGTSDLQSAIMLQPGNSGGPLLNAQGMMIGVNKSILLSATGENEQRSFATNVATASQFFEQHKGNAIGTESPIADHAVPMPSEPLDYGLPPPTEPLFRSDAPQPASGSRLGAIVDGETLIIQIVEPESPAEKAGLNAGDRLTQVNDQPLHHIDDLQAFLETKPDRATFTVSRGNESEAVTVEF